MARGNIEKINVVRAAPVNANAPTQFSKEFPLGPGWYAMMIRLNIAVTIGTGAGPITEGILNYLRQIYLRTDAGETIVDNMPARAMYRIAQVIQGTAPEYDAIAAASATYRIDIPIFFADPRMLRPEDTVLDTSRYKSVTLDIVTGPLTDLFTSPGTATVSLTADIDILKSRGRWPSAEAPVMGYVQYTTRKPIDASSTTEIELERAADASLKRLFIHTSASGTSGMPWYGTNADDVIDYFSVEDGDAWYGAKNLTWGMNQDDNKLAYEMESVVSGLGVVDFVRDGSMKAALYMGDKTNPKLTWTNQAGVAASDYVTVACEYIRALKLDAEKAAA